VIAHEPSVLSMKAAVDRVRDRHIAAVNAGDTDAATDVFAPDGVLLPPGQPALKGHGEIRGWFTYVFASFHIQGFAIEPAAVESHGDLAIEYGSWNAVFRTKDGSSSLPAGGTYLTVYARLTNGDVHVIRDTFNGMP
jgi:uncharacterized protein (TIGR02246 family)